MPWEKYTVGYPTGCLGFFLIKKGVIVKIYKLYTPDNVYNFECLNFHEHSFSLNQHIFDYCNRHHRHKKCFELEVALLKVYLFTVLSYLVDKSSHGLSWFVNITREDSISILSVSQCVNKIPLVTYRFTRVSPEFWYVNNVKIRSISIPNPWFHTAFVLSFSKEFARDVTLILVQKAD